MSERTAVGLIYAGEVFLTCVAVLGLSALGANPQTVFLGFLCPLALGSYAMSRVTMHYARSGHRRDR
ncbi:MAG TPA: hypothetical protein VHR18_08640 [Solirubrobacterales bacterium]|jgi:hypothetical protein|nr:hypothetical protein [Solirubrobacterales bacterium]